MNRLIAFLILGVILISCETQNTSVTEPLFTSSQWIGGQEPLPENEADLYLDHAAPILRKDFKLKNVPDAATMSITAAGYYTLWINGQRIGDAELSPAWTNYSKRIFYRDFDVQDFLKKGINTIAVELGNGWYNPLPLRMWGHRNIRESLPVGAPRMISDLRLSKNGEVFNSIVSDSTWKTSTSEITRNSIYLGEWHNMNLSPGDWMSSDFKTDDWENVKTLDAPGGILELADFPPIRKTVSREAVSIWPLGQGKWMVDFGQNMAGRFKYSGPVSLGDSLFFRMGERIWPDSTLNPMTTVAGQIKREGVGGPGAPAIAEQVDVFIPANQDDTFEPRYSFHGFRYIEISGLESTATIQPEDFTAFRMGTDVSKISTMESNLDWINKLQDMSEWTLLSNVFSVASDCPAREKFGYGGDLNATAETWLYNYDAKSIFVKWAKDWKDAMKDDGFVDTAPFVGIEYCGIAWESAYLVIQDFLFKFYGDDDLVKEWYPDNQEWMKKAEGLLGKGLVKNGLADHEALIRVPVELIGSLYYYQCHRIMQKFAALTGDVESEVAYKEFADEYRIMLLDSLWINPVVEMKNLQTWISGLLYHDILPPQEQLRAMSILVTDIKNRGVQLTTGIFGTPWLLEVLAKYGEVQLAYDLVSREEYPGWRHMIDNGATTIWETWKESDNVFSQNHPMFSTVSAFFQRWIGGLDPVDDGFKRVMIHPAPVKGIGSFSVSRQVNNEVLSISWKRTKTQVIFDMVIPKGVEAIWIPQILVPAQLESIMGPNGVVSTSENAQILFNDPGRFKLTYTL